MEKGKKVGHITSGEIAAALHALVQQSGCTCCPLNGQCGSEPQESCPQKLRNWVRRQREEAERMIQQKENSNEGLPRQEV